MAPAPDLLERHAPDRIETDELSPAVAAEVDFLAGRAQRWSAKPDSPQSVRARALASLGETEAARHALDAVDIASLSAIDVHAAVWAVSRVGTPTQIEDLLARLLDGNDDFVTVDGVPVGMAAVDVGSLQGAQGDLSSARSTLEAAARLGDARSPVWGALARAELARVLQTGELVGQTGDHGAAELAARTFFSATGWQAFLTSHEADLTGKSCPGVASAGSAHLQRGDRYFLVGLGMSPPVRVKASKGFRVLRHLVERPGVEVPALVLGRVADDDDAGELLTPELLRQLEDDPEGVRLAFRDDRDRSRVSKLLRRTIQQLEATSPTAGRHFAATVTTGHQCCYSPMAKPVLRWHT